jgi:tetratricopeptide (TPR) repeat protein
MPRARSRSVAEPAGRWPRGLARLARAGLAASLVLAAACARAPASHPPDDGSAGAVAAGASEAFVAGASDSSPPVDPEVALAQAESALAGGDAARAVALFGRVLASPALPDERAAPAWIGLAQAHERLRDCVAAIRAYEAYLARFPTGEHAVGARARRGACEAELEQWEESAASYHAIAERPELLPSERVEALAREGYALFMLDRMDEADVRLAEADAIFERAVEERTERFASTEFVGMARFYRAAILHRRFRDIEIRLPEAAMQAAFTAKLELLVKAQDAYNHAIAAKHMFWVSAAGYQLGHLFSELYDALMHAPVPEWLDARQREIYFEELKKQARPVVTKAIWVFEKNLETARRLGYESEFIARTEEKLGHLQAVMLSDDVALGHPHPRLADDADAAPDDAAIDARAAEGQGSASDRKLFVPRPTPL